jgi:hypothetical protein
VGLVIPRKGTDTFLELARKYDLKFAQIKIQAMNFTKGKDKAVEMRRNLIKTKTIGEIEKIMR